MKKLKQASREALSQEYYQTAATVGDITLQIKKLEEQRANLLGNMGVTLKRIQAMPLSQEAQDEIVARVGDVVEEESSSSEATE